MKVLSLLQPWATLVVIGAKKIETRIWNTQYRGPLLIYASLGKKYGNDSCRELCYKAPFDKYIKGGRDYDKLPFGAIIGSVNLTDTNGTHFLKAAADDFIDMPKWKQVLSEEEIAFGDYSPSRYGWLLSDAVKFENPIPARGSLSLWDPPFDICHQCGCHDKDCSHCIEKTGNPCYWVAPNICSACI